LCRARLKTETTCRDGNCRPICACRHREGVPTLVVRESGKRLPEQPAKIRRFGERLERD
jgi:hypothetical protein